MDEAICKSVRHVDPEFETSSENEGPRYVCEEQSRRWEMSQIPNFVILLQSFASYATNMLPSKLKSGPNNHLDETRRKSLR